MAESAFDTRYRIYRRLIEDQLRSFFTGTTAWSDLYEAMRYSLLAGGKRLRPMLTLEFARISGLGEAWQAALLPACAVELLHTYSLIHDDLPCMDDDDLRRGRPSNHKVYGETMAVLAGDALQSAAFEAIFRAPLPARCTAACAWLLAHAAGPDGMAAGQVLDTLHHPRSEEELLRVHALKTGALISAACLMGCECGNAGEEMRAAAASYAENLGLAFQIRDDLLDVTGSEADLGKPVGSDRDSGKVTFVDLYGAEGCERLVLDYTGKARQSLEAVSWDAPADFLLTLADRMAKRKH